MNLYLPIAETAANIYVYIGIAAAVGFLSGIIGVGGSILIAPLLILTGIPSAVAVGTGSAQIVSSLVSGSIEQYRRRNVDFKMGTVLFAGGLAGSVAGVEVVHHLRRIGQFDFFVSVCYVFFLGVVGLLMLIETLATMQQVRREAVARHKRQRPAWITALPLKMRFSRSMIYISAIPPLAIGAFVGLLAAIMGVGGGFVMIPAMIYVLKMPTNVVIGTSLFQIGCVTALTTVLHATNNQNVDVVLAFLLMVGAVVGTEVGSLVGQHLRGEQLRFLLAALVLLVTLRIAWDLIAPPAELYSVDYGREAIEMSSQKTVGGMAAVHVSLAAAPGADAVPRVDRHADGPSLSKSVATQDVASGYRLEADVSMRSIAVDVRFSGARLVMFGSASEVGLPATDAGSMDIVAVVQGARSRMTVRRKSHVWGLWLNTRSIDFEQAPAYYAVASTRPLKLIATTEVLSENGIGFEQIPISTALGEAAGLKPALLQEFRNAAIQTGVRRLNYVQQDGGVEFVGKSLFRSRLDLPATIAIGELDVSVFLFRGGQIVARTDSHVQLAREGFESFIYDFAHRYALLYGLATVALATCFGVASSVVVGWRRR